ncbi:hypothetical protein AB0J83_14995 [Actinoplanes sp. NPDC049596]|uniref:hypothetical protein n=1 Tax=unclassified Actinoplanes TaxID=2626549 RepID=UPI003435270A
MNSSRRIGALVAMAGAAVSVATVSVAAPAVAAERGPQPVTTWLRAVRANVDSEVKVYFRTDTRICNAEVRVSARDVDVDYPGRARSAEFSRGDTLRPGRSDYVEFDVNPDFDRAGIARLRTMLSYDNCNRRARTQVRTFTLTLPVLRNDRPSRPDRPGDHDQSRPDRPGDSNNPSRPDRPSDNNPSRPDRPSDNNPSRPDRPSDNNPSRPDRPGSNDNDNNDNHHGSWPSRPATTASANPAVTTPATTATTPATTATTTAPAATTTAAPAPTGSAHGDRNHDHRDR